jgi:hypothetical protein
MKKKIHIKIGHGEPKIKKIDLKSFRLIKDTKNEKIYGSKYSQERHYPNILRK